jgi:hypothetical protein
MDKLKPSITLEPEIDTIELRPPTSIDVDTWREITDALIKRCEDSMTDCDDLRSTMLSVPAKCDVTVRDFDDNCGKALDDKLALSIEARDEVRMLLEQTKEEIVDSIREIETLEATIDAQQIPLSFATTRLDQRRARFVDALISPLGTTCLCCCQKSVAVKGMLLSPLLLVKERCCCMPLVPCGCMVMDRWLSRIMLVSGGLNLFEGYLFERWAGVWSSF